MKRRDDEYLWDPTGTPDADVQRLERLLGRFAHDGRGPRVDASRRVSWAWLAGVGLVAAAGVVAVLALRGEPRSGGLDLVVDGRRLDTGERVTARGGDRELVLGGNVAWLTLRDGGALRVERLAEQETLLALEEGQLHAFVAPTARPEFFKVDTPAARCVDMGCVYDLRVLPGGDAHVVVTMGRVKFQDHGREVYVPSMAECSASRELGAGTPRYLDTATAVVAALDAFDAAGVQAKIDRAYLAATVLDQLERPRDALIAWHLLQDREAPVARAAVRKLETLVGRPEGLDAAAGEVPTAADRERWKQHLGWW